MVADQDERNEIDEMDRLFREADFAAEDENLEKRLRERIFRRLSGANEAHPCPSASAKAAHPAPATRKLVPSGEPALGHPCPSIEFEEERELGIEELSGLAAAGTGEDRLKILSALRKLGD